MIIWPHNGNPYTWKDRFYSDFRHVINCNHVYDQLSLCCHKQTLCICPVPTQITKTLWSASIIYWHRTILNRHWSKGLCYLDSFVVYLISGTQIIINMHSQKNECNTTWHILPKTEKIKHLLKDTKYAFVTIWKYSGTIANHMNENDNDNQRHDDRWSKDIYIMYTMGSTSLVGLLI